MWKETIVYAQDTAPEGGAQGMGSMLPFIILMFGVFYFLLIRPNQKRERAKREMLGALAKGDKVITSGGVCGTIVGLNEKTVVLKVGDDPFTKIEFLRPAISQVTSEEADDNKASKDS